MTRGRFITLEGGEGSGKSTQVQRLVATLAARGLKAIATREVGGSPSAEEIRELWLGKGEGHWDPLTEVFLIMAARREHLVRAIWPALEQGTWVISDRFVDSSRAYQGMGLDLGVEKIDAIYAHIANDFWPDLTLLLDLPVEMGLARIAARNGPDDRYQQRDTRFHEKLRRGYRALAEKDPARWRLVDASGDPDHVAAEIAALLIARFSLPER
ncbi:MAG: dTMP kinase [Alphaproteobacteria bacterium]|nr:dTMP kinase [Alphaproteobacteria bacterium]